nr:TPA_asm: hypothetical protein HUJ06_023760 [Nelumbo nucifera]
MATYFPSSSNQREVMPTLYSVPTSFPDAPVLPGNMMCLNYASSARSYTDALAGNSQPQQNCVELSSVGTSESTLLQQGILSNFLGSHFGEQNCGLWRDGRNEMSIVQPSGGPTNVQPLGEQLNSGADDLVRSSVGEDSQMGLGTQLGILQGGQNLKGQGLSLSLGSQIPCANPMPSFQYRHPNQGLCSFLSSHQSISGDGGRGASSCRDEESSQSKQSRNAEYLQPDFLGGNHDAMKREGLNNFQCSMGPKLIHSDPYPYGMSGLPSTIPNSKYLKAAQQLLDEVVNVRSVLKQSDSNKQQNLGLKGSKDTYEEQKGGTSLPSTDGMPSNPQESSTNSAEISPAERQDLQNKMTKLLAMLDEVDRRYKQYHHQMQIVVSSFDVIAGSGAAKPYTALALQTISRHFRCLRDAISGQIHAIRTSLGEQDSKGVGISRLRYVDQQLRQQRALQQFGMMQQHAWRPQRGLPESSVSILRAWLFEHFLHP